MRSAVLVALLAAPASAEPAKSDAPLFSDDTWRVSSTGDLRVDAGFVTGFPAALPTGLTSGAGGGVTVGQTLAWGARASVSTATESTIAWTVQHVDLRLRMTGAVQKAAGRGLLALRVGLGTTVIHETRTRNQGMRAGLSGSDLETTALDALPAGDLEGVIALHIAGPWLAIVSGGPSLAIVDGGAHASWTAELGIGWQP
jgi:hypothetical protein